MRPILLVAALFLLLFPRPSVADSSPAALCRAAISAAERSSGVPDRLMQAVGIVESGRPDERGGVSAWPWTINVEGTGYVFNTKAEAIAAVNSNLAQGVRSIDVGCMQVNLMHHGTNFASLDQAFDPVANALYAARFLQQLLAQTGSWPRAAAGYHSMTPDIGADYARKVLAVWARPGLGDTASLAPFRRGPIAESMMPPISAFTNQPPHTQPQTIPTTSAQTGPIGPAPGNLAMAGSLTARIIPLASGGSNAPTGRGLDAYRAMPTRMATMVVLPKS